MEDKSCLINHTATSPDLKCNVRPAHRVLVVDDAKDMLEFNASILRGAGYHVEEATDGLAAWEKIQSATYDLLVTDNSMPRISGVELIGKVRASGMGLPVVMATGLVPEAQFAQNPRCQPSTLLLKPYTSTEFLTTVKNVLCGVLSLPDQPSLKKIYVTKH